MTTSLAGHPNDKIFNTFGELVSISLSPLMLGLFPNHQTDGIIPHQVETISIRVPYSNIPYSRYGVFVLPLNALLVLVRLHAPRLSNQIDSSNSNPSLKTVVNKTTFRKFFHLKD